MALELLTVFVCYNLKLWRIEGADAAAAASAAAVAGGKKAD